MSGRVSATQHPGRVSVASKGLTAKPPGAGPNLPALSSFRAPPLELQPTVGAGKQGESPEGNPVSSAQTPG